MNIGMILNSRFPPDIRVEKEARSLIAAGYKVYLLTNPLEGRPQQEEINGIVVRRVPSMNKVNFWLQELKFYITLQDELWSSEINKLVEEFGINVLHVHDLPMVGTAIEVAEKKSIPIVADLHENYPAALQVWRSPNRGLQKKVIDRLFKDIDRWSKYEKECVQKVDRVIVVVDEAKERILRYGIPENKVTVVMNVEDISAFENIQPDQETLRRYNQSKAFVVGYIGGFGPHRGLDTAIEAIALVRREIPEVKLLLVGAQKGKYFQVLMDLVHDLDVENSVEIAGWQPFSKVPTYIQVSDVCLVPHHRNPHTDNTIPHKLFQYMLMGKPVIVSDCRPLKRIVEETRAGLVFKSGDAYELAEKILVLYKNAKLREKYGEWGRMAVMNKYNWQNESRKLINLYKNISKHVT